MNGQSAITNPTGKELACIIARNQDSPRFLRELLTQAIVFERLLTAPPGRTPQ